MLALLIVFYQRFLTRFTNPCPATPCCSDYGLRAARLHGSIRGGAMAWRRVRSCGVIAAATSGIWDNSPLCPAVPDCK